LLGITLKKQVAAGIGQAILTTMFTFMFSKRQVYIAQVLLTRDQVSSLTKKSRLSILLRFYLAQGIIPILNENDAIELNSFGGNDFLAAEVTQLLNADQLVILSTMKGSKYGVGGTESKKQAVEMINNCNIPTTILNGKTKNVLLEGI
jgi:glutamate 5-kinase